MPQVSRTSADAGRRRPAGSTQPGPRRAVDAGLRCFSRKNKNNTHRPRAPGVPAEATRGRCTRRDPDATSAGRGRQHTSASAARTSLRASSTTATIFESRATSAQRPPSDACVEVGGRVLMLQDNAPRAASGGARGGAQTVVPGVGAGAGAGTWCPSVSSFSSATTMERTAAMSAGVAPARRCGRGVSD